MTSEVRLERAARKTRLGWLGPVIVLVGLAAGGVAIWFMVTQRPVPGEIIDRLSVDGAGRELVLRKEASSDRSFIELRDRDRIVWQALIPHYAGEPGRPAVAWSDRAVTVRVARNGRAEVFAFSMDKAHKLGKFRLAATKEPITTHARGPITLTDHLRSYEIVSGPGWNHLIALDLRKGGGAWDIELGPEPVVAGGVAHVTTDEVWIQQGETIHSFDGATGARLLSKPLANPERNAPN